MENILYNDYIKYFKGALNCRIFYGRPDQEDEERAKCSVGGRVEDLDEELSKLDPKNPKTSKTFFLSSYHTFAGRCVQVTSTTIIQKGVGHIKLNPMVPMSDSEYTERTFTMLLKNKAIIGRTIADDAHLIKNPMTVAADAVLKVRAKRFIVVTATPMLNRATDLRGYLVQLHKGKDIGLVLPRSTAKLVSIFNEGFNPLVDQIPDEEGTPCGSILPARGFGPEADRLYDALENYNFPIHLTCPELFRTIGGRTKWDAVTSRKVLRPILKLIQKKRLMSTPILTVDGKYIIPGEAIPHYTVRTVKLRMQKGQEMHYHNITEAWRKKLNVPNDVAVQSKTEIKVANEEYERTFNIEAYRGLQHATFDMQLVPLTKRRVKNVPAGTSTEIASWYEMDNDHGVTYKYYKARPSVASYIPCPSNKLDMMSVHIGQSPKLRAFLTQVYEWKQQGERILAFFNWPMCQWDAEGLLNMMGMKVLSLASFHTSEERRKILAMFNDKDSDVDILLVGFRIGSYGLNFHGCCCKMIIMEYPMSIDILLQVFGRLHRFGAIKPQEIVIFFLEGSFDEYVRSRMAKKFISKLAAEGEFRHIDDQDLLVEAMKVVHRLLGEEIIDNNDPDLRKAITEVLSDQNVPAEEKSYDDDDDDSGDDNDFEKEYSASFEEEVSDRISDYESEEEV